MSNRTVATLPLGDKLKQRMAAYKTVWSMAGAAVTGFVMAHSFVFGGTAPFGVAFAAALPERYAAAAALGALGGYALSGFWQNMKYSAGLLCVVLLKWLLTDKWQNKADGIVACLLVAFVSMGTASTVALAVDTATLYDVLLSGAELFLLCAAVYFFCRTWHTLQKGLDSASQTQLSCVVISVAIVLMGLSGFQWDGISLGRILAVCLILFCARQGGEGAGATGGIVAGLAMGLAGTNYGFYVSAYGLGGLVAGIFGRTGRLAAAGAFVLVNGITALFTWNQVDSYASLWEIFIATALYIALPQRWTKSWQVLGKAAVGDNALQQLTEEKLRRAAKALREIGTTTRQVSQKLGKREEKQAGQAYAYAAERVCRHCGNRTACWQLRYEALADAMTECDNLLKKSGSLHRDNAPRYFSRNCCKLDSLLGEMNESFRDSMARDSVRRKVTQVRSVLTDQFDGMAAVLEDISEELNSVGAPEPRQTAQARAYFNKKGLRSEKMIGYRDKSGRLRVEAKIPVYQLARFPKEVLALELGDLLETDFDLPQITVGEKEALLSFGEKALIVLQTGVYQAARGKNRLCGDSYQLMTTREGVFHTILSDGMGSGGGAAVDSSMTAGLLTSLLTVGIGPEAALKMVNSALLIKSGEESLATVDVCTVDLFTGQADFYKAGAAPSYILRQGRALCVASTSLPAGILRGVAFEKTTMTLHTGDVIVLVSDGVTATGEEWVLSELAQLWKSGDGEVEQLCEKLAATARARRQDGYGDDVTVIGLLLEKT